MRDPIIITTPVGVEVAVKSPQESHARYEDPTLAASWFLSVAKDLPAFLTDHVYSTAIYFEQKLCCKTTGEPLRYMMVMAVVSAILAVSSREEGSIKANPTSCQLQMSCIWLLQTSYLIWDSRVRATDARIHFQDGAIACIGHFSRRASRNSGAVAVTEHVSLPIMTAR